MFRNQATKRYTVYPIENKETKAFVDISRQQFWDIPEIPFDTDLYDYSKKLTDAERRAVNYVLGFFVVLDGIVNDNLCERFLNDVDTVEEKMFYRFQMAMEDIHAETYSLFITTLITDPVEREKLFNSIENISEVKAKVDWTQKWIESNESYAERVFAMACVESISFSASFCIIFWLKSRNLLSGLCHANELINRDEGLHAMFACHQFMKVPPSQRPPRERLIAILCECVATEELFINAALSEPLAEMNASMMLQHTQSIADTLLRNIDQAPYYRVKSPFSFMNLINLDLKSNLHERRSSNYQGASSSDATVGMIEDL